MVDEKVFCTSAKQSIKYFDCIHNWFVVTQIDKSNEDIEFICQWFYALVLIKDFPSDHNNTCTNETYAPAHKTNNQVIYCHTTFSRNKSNLVINE